MLPSRPDRLSYGRKGNNSGAESETVSSSNGDLITSFFPGVSLCRERPQIRSGSGRTRQPDYNRHLCQDEQQCQEAAGAGSG